MKTTYRVPHPRDQYAFVEVEHEADATLTPEEIRDNYDLIKSAFSDGQGVGMKEFAKIVHEYCTTGAIVDGGDKDFSANEKLLLGELKKLVREDQQMAGWEDGPGKGENGDYSGMD